MLLSDIFEALQYGELKQLPVSGKGAGIPESSYDELLSHVNNALTAVFKRFPLKLKTVTVQELDNVTTYALSSRYAVSNPVPNEYKYIIDTELNPFIDDVLKVEGIKDELGVVIPLNTPSVTGSIVVTDYNTIQVPFPDSTKAISVTYRAKHHKIVMAGVPPTQIHIELSDSYMRPLLMYIAHRATIGTSDNDVDSNTYLSKFTLACDEIDRYGLVSVAGSINCKPGANGWV